MGAHRKGAGEPFEIGYWLAPDRWGQGYTTEAARALMEDHVLGTEFYLQLRSLLEDAPGEISYDCGEDVF